MAGDQQIKNSRIRSYVAKDFDAMRSDLLNYARTYFGDKIQDFSEASVGGLLLDLAASVTDNMHVHTSRFETRLMLCSISDKWLTQHIERMEHH